MSLGSNIQILFVDDDLEFSWLVVAYVKKRLNVPVRVAQSYSDAATLIGAEHFDLIVCALEESEESAGLFRFTLEHSSKSRFVLFTANDEYKRDTLVAPTFAGHIPKNQIFNLVALILKSTTAE
jgi:hypothetical protein